MEGDPRDDLLSVKYIADSNHQWKYGKPSPEYFSKFARVQILIHPLSWTQEGSDHVECFRVLADEKRTEFIETVKNEWKIFLDAGGKTVKIAELLELFDKKGFSLFFSGESGRGDNRVFFPYPL